MASGILFFASIAGSAAVMEGVAQSNSAIERVQSNQLRYTSSESAVALTYRAGVLKAAFLSGDEGKIEKAVREVDQLREEYSTLDVTPLVEAMGMWAYELGEKGEIQNGYRILYQMNRWAPENTAILSTEIMLKRREGPVGYLESIASAIKLSQIRFENPTSRYIYVIQHVTWIKFAATAILWGIAVVLALKYRRLFRRILEHPLTKKLSNRHHAAVIAAALFVLPILLGFDPSFSAFIWILLLTPILKSSELIIGIFCIFIQLVHPSISWIENSFISNKLSFSIKALQMQPQLISLKSRPLNKLSEQDQYFLLGWEMLHSGNWTEAEQIFKTLHSQSYESAAALNNLGVALYHLDKTDIAREAFINAGRINSKAIEPIYNQAITEFARLDYNEAEKKLAEAQRIDPVEYAYITNSTVTRAEHKTFAMPIHDTIERSNALSDSYKEIYLNSSNKFQKNTTNTTNIIWIIWPLLGVLAVLYRRVNSTNLIKFSQCDKCGEVFRELSEAETNTCLNCYHFFIAKDASIMESRSNKINETKRFQWHQKCIYRLLKISLPGGDKIFLGSTVYGFAIFLTNAILIGMFVCSLSNVYYPGEIIPDPPSTLGVMGLFFAGIIYIQSWFKLLLNRL